MAADASHVYWADEGDLTAGNGTISEANPDGTSPHAIVTGQTTPTGVAVDPSHLYWASNGDGTVNQANLDGSSPHAIVTGQNNLSGVASDASHLYWVSRRRQHGEPGQPGREQPARHRHRPEQPAWMAVTPAAPELSLSPAPYDYGSVPPGSRPRRRSR